MPSVATKVISASPIISAAAVFAVRPGLRVEFSLASRPGAPPARRAGEPTTAASGTTSRPDTSATPMNRSSVPTPSGSSTPAIPLARKSPSASSASASTRSPPAIHVDQRENRDFGSTAPSRTAAIGGTRVAWTAGKMPATTVTITPASSETTTVRVAKTVPVCGRSAPSATKIAFSPFAIASPRKSPITAANSPIANASIITDRSTCRREAPSVRSVANSRARCATVIAIVLKMTNEPTKSAIAANASRRYLMKLRPEVMFLASFFPWDCPVSTCAFDGTSGASSRRSCLSLTPGLPAIEITSI